MSHLNLFLVVLIFTLTACSNNVINEESPEEVNTREEAVLESDTESNFETNNSEEYDYNGKSEDSGLSERPPKIKQIKVEAISNNLEDGFMAVVTTHEEENEDINFIYQWKHNGIDIIGATEQKLEWNEEFRKGDVITLEIIPYDDLTDGIWKSEGNFSIPNSPPAIESTPPATINGNSFTYKVNATDLDGDILTYTLRNAPEGMRINPETGEINWEYGIDNAGEYKIGIEVSDGDGGQIFQELTVTVN